MADTSKKKNKSSSAPKAPLRTEESAKAPSADEVDEFVAGANRWGERLRPHAKKLTALAVLIVVAGVGWAVYRWQAERKAMKATTAFSQALNTSLRLVMPPADEPDPATADPATADPTTESEKPFPTRAARAEATLAALDGAEAIGAPSALLRGGALMDLKRYDDAARAYSEAASGLPPEAAAEARASIAYAYEAKAEATEDAAAREKTLLQAMDAFKAMQPAADGVRHDEAMFHEARILAVLGKRDEAIAAYKKTLEAHPDTLLKAQIETRLEMLGTP